MSVTQRIFLVLGISFLCLAMNITLTLQGNAHEAYAQLCNKFPSLAHCQASPSRTP